MVQLIGWCLLLIAVSTGIAWFMDNPGYVSIRWLGYEISLSIGVLIALAAFFFLIIVLLLNVVRSLLGTSGAAKHRRLVKKQEKGWDALTDTVIALAYSDADMAAEKIKKVEKVTGETALTHLLHAQIAHKRDDQTKTRTHLESMLENKKTSFLARRALSSMAIESGQLAQAVEHAKEALRMKPNNVSMIRMVCDLNIRRQHWQEAEQLVRTARRFRRLPPGMGSELLCILTYLQSREALENEREEIAFKSAETAHKTCPVFIPATLHFIHLALKKKARRRVLNAIKRSWKIQPHHALSDCLFDLYQGDSETKLVKQCHALSKLYPNHPESQIILAQAYMKHQKWDHARNHLKSAISMRRLARIYQLLAEIERKQYQNEKAASDWLSKASEADPEAGWICSECGQHHPTWQLHCSNCHSFESIDWQYPREHLLLEQVSLLPGAEKY